MFKKVSTSPKILNYFSYAFKAAGKASTPDPAISPAKKIEAVIIPSDFSASTTGIKCSVSIFLYFLQTLNTIFIKNKVDKQFLR